MLFITDVFRIPILMTKWRNQNFFEGSGPKCIIMLTWTRLIKNVSYNVKINVNVIII